MTWVYYGMGIGPVYKIGFYDPKGEWHLTKETRDERFAQRLVNYLNGGTDTPAPVEPRI